VVSIFAQIGGNGGGQGAPSAFDLIAHGTAITWAVLGATALFSVASWIIILWKLGQFRKLKKEGRRFSDAMAHAQRLEDAHNVVVRLPDSPHSRVFRSGINFFSELRPGALKANAPATTGLSEAQLNALWLMLEKVQEEERDNVESGLVWLSIVAVVSPLLGLLGTVIGVMDSFLGVTATGSANIGAVAPGIAEALITTAFGLVAAIPAAIAYNFFLTKVNAFSGQMEGFASEFIGALAREGRL
jgi:biopolymer transport protein TolQ